MKLNDYIKNEIITKIRNNLKIKDIILFGSYANNKATEESDIDLVVILDKKGFAKSYMERLKNRNKISMLLINIKKEIPIDILVYTIDEWQLLLESGSLFYQEINQRGVRLI